MNYKESCEVTEGEGLEHADCVEQERQGRLRVLAQMREPFKCVPTEEIEREVAQVITDVRREKGSLAGGHVSALRSGGE